MTRSTEDESEFYLLCMGRTLFCLSFPLKNNNQSQDHAEDELRQQEISQRQIPLQDFDPKFCHDLDQFERKELKYFRNQVQEDAIGKAIEKNKHFKDEPVSKS